MQLQVVLQCCVLPIRKSLRAVCLRANPIVGTTVFRGNSNSHNFSQVEAPYLAGIPNSFPSSCNMLGPVLSEARTAAVMPCRFNGVRGIVKARRQLCLGLDRAGRRCGRRDTRCNMSTRRRSRHGISCLRRPHHLPVLGFPLELKHLST